MRGEPIHSAAMTSLPRPLRLLLMMFAGWVNRHQLNVIEYLREENRSKPFSVAVSVAHQRAQQRRNRKSRLGMRQKSLQNQQVIVSEDNTVPADPP
jgi:hypothetical protein